jgi:hypothetical protein
MLDLVFPERRHAKQIAVRIQRIVNIGDILMHTWNLAHAIGVDDTLSEEACQV